jgi:hypothetical protein
LNQEKKYHLYGGGLLDPCPTPSSVYKRRGITLTLSLDEPVHVACLATTNLHLPILEFEVGPLRILEAEAARLEWLRNLDTERRIVG